MAPPPKFEAEKPTLPDDRAPVKQAINDQKLDAEKSDAGRFQNVEMDDTTDLSFAAILKGTAHTPLTVFERKAALINVELDAFGMGKYQWCIWFLCGFGYFLDLAWAQGVGLAASAIYQEMDVAPGSTGIIFSCANAGLAVGALGFGLLVDIIGRKWAFNLTCLICSVFGMLVAAPRYNYAAVCGIYLLASIGLGGNIPVDALITLEFLPQKRCNLVSLLSLWQPVGVTFASAVALGTAGTYRCETGLPSCRADGLAAGAACCGVSNNMGWRYLVIILGSVTLFVFFIRYFIFPFHESPKFLLSQGKEAEAIEVLHWIAKFNKAPAPTLTLEHFQEIERNAGIHPDAAAQIAPPKKNAKQVVKAVFTSLKHLKGLFTNKLQLFIFCLLALAYMGDYWSFNLAGAFLPLILLQNNVDSGQGTVRETYTQYVIIYAPGIIGAVIALCSVQLPLVGRKWSLVFSAACQGLSMALYTQVTSTAGYVGLNALEYIMQTYFNAVLYASAPELFATAYRGSASGMLSCIGRLAGIVAPFAAQPLLDSKSKGILWLGAGGIWLSALVLIFLPVEMRNRQMY